MERKMKTKSLILKIWIILDFQGGNLDFDT